MDTGDAATISVEDPVWPSMKLRRIDGKWYIDPFGEQAPTDEQAPTIGF